MKEKPILFSGAMVRAILEGRKTQTRRIIKPQPEMYKGNPAFASQTWEKGSPYQVGMRLWVRETWAYDEEGRTIYKASDPSPSIRATVWKPSIHMTLSDSRLFLEVTSVRVERMQEITNDAFRDLWASILGPSSWDLNPFCWVIDFKRVEER